MKKYYLLISVISVCIPFISVESQSGLIIAPGELWPDTEGYHINAHGGAILKHKGTWYWFGEARLPRGERDRTNYGVGCYSSKNLIEWDNEGLALQVIDDTTSLLHPGCVIERPKVIYNKKTGKFVMWFHHELRGQGYRAALTGVAVSENVTGPYKYIRSLRPNAGIWPVNFPDEFINITLNEAPAIFHANKKYYMFSSGTTGWKPNPGRLASADKITGEWKSLGNPCRGTEEENNTTFRSQSTFILLLKPKKNKFIYLGDRWIPENLADSRHIWLPVEWEGDLPVIKWHKSWDLKQFQTK